MFDVFDMLITTGTIPLSCSDSKRPCDRFKITYPWNSKHGTKPVELLPVGMAHELICLWIENGHRNSIPMIFNNKYFIWNNCNCILITVGLQILLLNWVQTKINDGSNHWSASPPAHLYDWQNVNNRMIWLLVILQFVYSGDVATLKRFRYKESSHRYA